MRARSSNDDKLRSPFCNHCTQVELLDSADVMLHVFDGTVEVEWRRADTRCNGSNTDDVKPSPLSDISRSEPPVTPLDVAARMDGVAEQLVSAMTEPEQSPVPGSGEAGIEVDTGEQTKRVSFGGTLGRKAPTVCEESHDDVHTDGIHKADGVVTEAGDGHDAAGSDAMSATPTSVVMPMVTAVKVSSQSDDDDALKREEKRKRSIHAAEHLTSKEKRVAGGVRLSVVASYFNYAAPARGTRVM